MNAQQLIDQCRQSGVTIRLDGGVIKLRGDSSAVKSVAERIRPYKAKLLECLIKAASDGSEISGPYMPYVCVRPQTEWIAMIKELDALVERYCTEFRLSNDARSRILTTRYSQSLASIPEALAWFRAELSGDKHDI